MIPRRDPTTARGRAASARACVSLLSALLLSALPAAAGEGLEDVGRRIYWGDAPGEIVAEIGGASIAAPASRFGCANCHGRDGLGGGDAGVSFPPVAASALLAATGSRPAYDAQSFARAVRAGIGADGRPLDPAMPRYGLPDAEAGALFAYLERLEAETRTGIGDEAILLGVTAPDGREAARSIVAEALDAVATPTVFGRRLSFAIVPFEAEPERFADALARSGIFALVMPVLDPEGVVLEAARRAGVPVVAPWGGLAGFENPQDVRAVEASLAARKAALAQKAEELARERGAASVSIAAALPAEADLRGRTLVGMLDELGPHAEALRAAKAEVVLLDTRFVRPPQDGRHDVERQAAIALRLVTEGLRLSGADPTRAKFMRALGRVALKTDYWPALDYRLHPLTGTGEWRFMELPALP